MVTKQSLGLSRPKAGGCENFGTDVTIGESAVVGSNLFVGDGSKIGADSYIECTP